jgi:selenocysteine lyase/cysteine desulfurase
MMDAKNIMVRTGKLCAEPLLKKLGVNGLIRLSWAAYTTAQDLELAFDTLGEIHDRISRHVQ